MKIELLGLSVFSFALITIFVLLIVHYYLLLKKIDSRFKWVLFLCRLSSIILLVILILDPWFNWKISNSLKPDLNIYLDNSKSITFIDSSINLNNKIDYINNWGKTNKVKVSWYLFGDSTRRLDNNSELFSDNTSSLKGLKRNIILDEKSNHLIITDGHINKGKKFDDLVINNNNIYVLGFGNQINNTDCYISSIKASEINDNIFDISINLGCFIDKESLVTVECTLNNYKDEIIVSKEKILKFNKNGFHDITLENINGDDLSVFNRVHLKTNLEDLNQYNNSKYFTIDKKEESKKVLLLTGGVSPNTKFIKKIIKDKFNNLEVDHYYHQKQFEFNILDNYSLIILDNFPFSDRNLFDYNNIINNSFNIPVIYFEGPGLSIPIAEKISKELGLNLSLIKKKDSNLELINNHFLFNKINFNKIPPVDKNISFISENSQNIPATYFSNQSIAAIKNGKLTSIFIPNLSNANLIESNLFNTTNVIDYTYNMILYGYEPKTDLINLNIEKYKYTNNNMINADIDFDEKLVNTDFYLNIYNLVNKTSSKIKLDYRKLNNGSYNFEIKDPGNYYIEVLSESDNLNFTSNREYVSVSDFDIESEFLYQNKKSLHNFKIQNNAVYFDFDDLEESLDRVELNKIVNIKQSNFNSLSTQYYWIVFIILLVIEWYLRKRSKLL